MKRSGFAVKITAFIEADAFDGESLALAKTKVQSITPWLEGLDFKNIEIRAQPRHRVEIFQSPPALAAEQVEERAAGRDEMPPIPAGLRRA